jgi:tetratricopeptide (TPR) repeat protein
MKFTLDYNKMLLFDAEDPAEAGIKDAYQSILEAFGRYVSEPAEVQDVVDHDVPSYTVRCGALEYVIDVRARILLANQLASSAEDEEECIRHLQTAATLRPNDSNTLYNAACTYGVLGKKSEALETFKKAFAAGYANLNWAGCKTAGLGVRPRGDFRNVV